MVDYEQTDALSRVMLYQVYLSSPSTNSISLIEKHTGISRKQIRKDFCKLLRNKYFNLCISDDNVISSSLLNKVCEIFSISISKDDFVDFFADVERLNSDELNNLIMNGYFDEVSFEIESLTEEIDKDWILVPVQQFEYAAFSEMFSQSKKQSTEKNYFSSGIRYKKHLHSFDASILDKLNSIEIAIKNDLSVRYKYRFYPNVDKEVKILPSKIGFDATTNRYSVISSTNSGVKVFDLDYIIGEIKFAQIDEKQNPILLSRADKVWGFEFDKCYDESLNIVPPTRVLIEFKNEANVISKVKRDLKYRNPLKLVDTEDGNLLYEDEIYGTESFIRWILSFGKSVKILAPESLISDYLRRI